MEEFIKSLTTLDWPAVIGMGILAWYFTHDLRKSNNEILSEIRSIREDLKTQAARSDKLYEMFCDLRKDTSQQFIELLKDGRK